MLLFAILSSLFPAQSEHDIDILINGKRIGKIGQVLTLNEGTVLVSVDLLNAEQKWVELCGTTPRYPKGTEIPF